MIIGMTLTAEAAAAIPPWSSPEGYMLRGYEPSDYDEWFELLLFIGPLSIWSAEKFRNILSVPEHRDSTRLIEDNTGALVASAYGGLIAGDGRPYMSGVGVHPDHRRKGLGFGVCAAVIAFLIEQGATCIGLGTGDSDRYLPARKFYEKLGFQYEDN